VFSVSLNPFARKREFEREMNNHKIDGYDDGYYSPLSLSASDSSAPPRTRPPSDDDDASKRGDCCSCSLYGSEIATGTFGIPSSVMVPPNVAVAIGMAVANGKTFVVIMEGCCCPSTML